MLLRIAKREAALSVGNGLLQRRSTSVEWQVDKPNSSPSHRLAGGVDHLPCHGLRRHTVGRIGSQRSLNAEEMANDQKNHRVPHGMALPAIRPRHHPTTAATESL